jgi:NTE family protein
MKSLFSKQLPKANKTKIGLALGGGGARGFVHIPVLQTLDDLGVKPAHISGTSMGAIIGAIYASGTSPQAIREIVDSMIIYKGEGFKEILQKRGLRKWFELIDPNFFKKGGVIKGNKIVEFLREIIGVDTFEELQIPLSIVATDFHTGEEVVFDSGPLMPAIRASMSLPGLFEPVKHEGRMLIDGGTVNPVPHDLLLDTDFVIAVDVSDLPQTNGQMPSMTDALMGAVEIMGRQLGDNRRAAYPPDIFLRPDFDGVEMTDFHRAEKIFADAQPICQRLKAELKTTLRLAVV